MSNIGAQQAITGVVWWVYMVRCRDGSLYTGITTSPPRRLAQHNGLTKGGARYTATRRPVVFVGMTTVIGRSAATVLECRLKKLSKKEKEAWCLRNPCES